MELARFAPTGGHTHVIISTNGPMKTSINTENRSMASMDSPLASQDSDP